LANFPSVKKLYDQAIGKAEAELVRTGFNVAMGWQQPKNKDGKLPKRDKPHAVMLMFLLKCCCGFREYAQDSEEDADTKAQLARETLERMNIGLEKFQAPDGAFQAPSVTDSKAVLPSQKKSFTKDSKKPKPPPRAGT
jgi:hypothetical protein